MGFLSIRASEHSASYPRNLDSQTPTATRTLKFKDSNEAHNWLHSVTMLPPIHPQSDPTINIIASDRTTWVLAMIDAIYDLGSCADNSKMLAHFQPSSPSFISELEIEAACHILFDILISYCRYGFQGLPKTNVHMVKSSGGRKNHEEDKTADCLTRMGNVIAALRSWKSVCKGMVEDDTKKWQLVNAPVGAVGKKVSERKCNTVKKKAAAEGKKARDELVIRKQGGQVAASGRAGLEVGHQYPVTTGEEALRSTGAAGEGTFTPQHQGLLACADGAEKRRTNHHEYADTARLQTHKIQGSVSVSYTHAPESFAMIYPEPQPVMHNLPQVNQHYDWPPTTSHWPPSGLQDDFPQHMQPLKIEDLDGHFWNRLGKFEENFDVNTHEQAYFRNYDQSQVEQPTPLDLLAQAAVQAEEFVPLNGAQIGHTEFVPPLPQAAVAHDAQALPTLTPNEVHLGDQVAASVDLQNVANIDTQVPMQPPPVLSPQRGVKRGRETEETREDEPAARRQKIDENH